MSINALTIIAMQCSLGCGAVSRKHGNNTSTDEKEEGDSPDYLNVSYPYLVSFILLFPSLYRWQWNRKP